MTLAPKLLRVKGRASALDVDSHRPTGLVANQTPLRCHAEDQVAHLFRKSQHSLQNAQNRLSNDTAARAQNFR